MKASHALTGHYSKQILDVYPRGDGELPSDEHFYAFFSKFGSILELYRHNSNSSSKTHVYIAFKTEAAIHNVKNHLYSPEGASYWKKSCGITTGIASCPTEFLKRVKANPSVPSSSLAGSTSETNKEISGTKGVPIDVGVSRQAATGGNMQALGKRNRDGPPHQGHKKKHRFIDETAATSQSMPIQRPESTQQSSLQDTRKQPPQLHGDRDYAVQHPSSKSSAHAPRSQLSALELAQQAAELASSKPRYIQGAASSDTQALLEQLRTERDEALLQRDAAIESRRNLEQELQQLKQSYNEQKAKTEKVLRLVTGSLQSLQEGLEETNR